MKKIFVILTVLFGFGSCASNVDPMNELVKNSLNRAAEHYLLMATTLSEGQFPRSVDDAGQLVTSNKYWWCSGFYPGSLWYLYEHSGDDRFRELASQYTEMLDSVKYVTNDHDVGFQLFCSYGNGYRLTRNPAYKDVLIQGAKSLSTRFNHRVGTLKSWDFNRENWSFPVIIDNMLNLELLMWTGNQIADTTFRDIAVSHALTTMKNHFRDNFSTYHLVDYDATNGSIRKKQTVQGAHDESSWARGQSWALYGYTMMYRYTGDKTFLSQAINIADFLIGHPNMPANGIPYWDYDAPEIPDTYRDASAGAIMASALLELVSYSSMEDKEKYLAFAEKQLKTLASDEYMAEPNTNNHFILKHSVGTLPGNSEIDKPLSYADYYFLEALLRYKKLKKIES